MDKSEPVENIYPTPVVKEETMPREIDYPEVTKPSDLTDGNEPGSNSPTQIIEPVVKKEPVQIEIDYPENTSINTHPKLYPELYQVDDGTTPKPQNSTTKELVSKCNFLIHYRSKP